MAMEALGKYLFKIPDRYDPDIFHFTYHWFEWVRPWPGYGMHLHIFVMAAAAIALMVGWRYRLAAIVYCFTYTHLFLIEKAAFNNHYYFICLLAFLFVVTDAHAEASLDKDRLPQRLNGIVPYWQLFLFRMQVVVVYFFGGIAKLNPDWLQGEPIRRWLVMRSQAGALPAFAGEEWFVYFIAYGGLLFDLSIGWLLLWRKTRLLAIFMVVFFHLSNSYIFSIGVFPWLGLAATLLFVEPSTCRRLLSRLGLAAHGAQEQPMQSMKPRRLAIAFTLAYLAIQVLLPLRHFAYGANPSWTEEGHQFAWHMKLRDKRAHLSYRVHDPATGAEAIITELDLEKRVTPKQFYRFPNDPQMIRQYARQLREEYLQKGMQDPKVYATSYVSLNGREHRPMIDPDADLASVEPSFIAGEPWILPLDESLEPGIYAAFTPTSGEGWVDAAVEEPAE